MSRSGDFTVALGGLLATDGTLGGGDTGASGSRTYNGEQIDLRPTTGKRYRHVACSLFHKTVLAANISLTLLCKQQIRSATTGVGSTWANFATANNKTITVPAAATGYTLAAAEQWNLDLTSASRYFRLQVVPTFSATTATTSSTDFAGAVYGTDVSKLT